MINIDDTLRGFAEALQGYAICEYGALANPALCADPDTINLRRAVRVWVDSIKSASYYKCGGDLRRGGTKADKLWRQYVDTYFQVAESLRARNLLGAASRLYDMRAPAKNIAPTDMMRIKPGATGGRVWLIQAWNASRAAWIKVVNEAHAQGFTGGAYALPGAASSLPY